MAVSGLQNYGAKPTTILGELSVWLMPRHPTRSGLLYDCIAAANALSK